jgi:hypothetical protein
MDYARHARTGNPSIAGKHRLARTAEKVGAPHNAARKATASRVTSARRVAGTVHESPEVDWVELEDEKKIFSAIFASWVEGKSHR